MKKNEQKKLDACKDFADVYEIYADGDEILAYQAAVKIYRIMGEPTLTEVCDLFTQMAELDLSWACDCNYMDFIMEVVSSVIKCKFEAIETMIKQSWGIDEDKYLWCVNKRNELNEKYND